VKGEFKVKIRIFDTKMQMAKSAAEEAKRILVTALNKKGKAVLVVATGTSQIEFLEYLTHLSYIDWSKVEMFHLDEYIGLSEDHPASFRKYLKEHLIDKVHPGEIHMINGDSENPEKECERLNNLIKEKDIDISFVGIGENCHLAFNDPPADFEIDKPYIIVNLDKTCRNQQVKEGWFDLLDNVPTQAISMSIKQILRSENIICVVPDERKAIAVRNAIEGGISPNCPASILKTHNKVSMFLDKESSKLLHPKTLREKEGDDL
jgi:glucosamine-6-phosphate deaminase